MKASKIVIWIISGIVVLIAILLAFRGGMVVGYRQAMYSEIWLHSRGVSKNLSIGRGGWLQSFDNPKEFFNDHGAIGTITSVQLATTTDAGLNVIVHDIHDSIDKNILVYSTTTILGTQGNATGSPLLYLRVGQNIAVIGAPNSNGQIVAGIIHMLPPSPVTEGTSSFINYY